MKRNKKQDHDEDDRPKEVERCFYTLFNLYVCMLSVFARAGRDGHEYSTEGEEHLLIYDVGNVQLLLPQTPLRCRINKRQKRGGKK